MKITDTQIKELYKFTRKHFVEHYDLQTELVDHLAHGIEAQWQLNPQMTFKEARLKEFRKFGITGFEKVIRKRRNSMTKRYWKIILRFYKEYFQLPKILGTLMGILSLTAAIQLIPENYKIEFFVGSLFLMCLIVLFFHIRKRKEYNLEKDKSGKKWMLKDLIYSVGDGAQVLNCFAILLNNGLINERIARDSIYIDLSFALLLIGLLLLYFVIMFVIPSKAEELLEETYPEYKMV